MVDPTIGGFEGFHIIQSKIKVLIILMVKSRFLKDFFFQNVCLYKKRRNLMNYIAKAVFANKINCMLYGSYSVFVNFYL